MSNKYNDPVVWYDGKKFYVSQEAASMCLADMVTLKPLYAAPPKREPLSDEQIDELHIKHTFSETGPYEIDFARAIERAVWEKLYG